MELDSESKTSVDLINNNNGVENHPERTLIEACRKLKIDIKSEVSHILKEDNRCVDGLAKLRATQSELHVRILVPSDDVVEDLMAEMIQVSYPRGS